MNEKTALGFYARYIKRLLDIFISGTALIFLLPLFLVVAILTQIKMGSPVLFRQERPGKNEKIFNCLKFRTMTDERDENGELLEEAKRITGFGLFLRKTSIDELPELLNVFKGDMSLIGPRPLLVRYLPYYRGEELLRHEVRPGLTGLAQVSGRNFIGWDARFAKDVEYVKNISFALDVKIFFKTIKNIVSREGIASDPNTVELALEIERGGGKPQPADTEKK